ncbi:MAG: lysoplasmalogenase [Flavobacteriaceae bacterium]|nr:lysoplasmalogenase [Flavobacteriaceae bacterium]
MNKILPLIAFMLFCLIDFFGIYLDKQMMVNFAKPMLMITLFWYYYSNAKKLNKYFVLGLFFSFLGDILLLGTGEMYFVFGLLFFLIAHVFYIIIVLKIIQITKPKEFIIASVPFLLLFLVLMNVLYAGLGAIKIPVIIYAITISFFGIVSLILYLQAKTKISMLLLVGVLTFIASDTILALNLFYKKQSFYPLLIMMTYVLAQYLICRFVLKLNQQS